ncbi:hypothetical protein EMCRGX_G011719 [Ephydatia muelleri]
MASKRVHSGSESILNYFSKKAKDMGKTQDEDIVHAYNLIHSVISDIAIFRENIEKDFHDWFMDASRIGTLVAENRKHKYNDRKCEELGWVFIPLVVETYGCWGAAAVAAFSKLAGHLSTRLNQPESKTIFGIYSRLGLALRKHDENDAKCKKLGWICIPTVVEAYGAWGTEALESFSLLASRLATSSNRAKAEVLAALYGRLNLNLVRANATAILSRCFVPVY